MKDAVGFIGGGKMSSAIFKGIIKTGCVEPKSVWVSGPHLEHLEEWSGAGAITTDKNGNVVENCNVIFIGVKPAMLETAVEECLKTIPKNFDKNVLFISMLAGVPISQLDKELGRLTKNYRLIRIMPNTPMTVGEGACLYTPGQSATATDCKTLEKYLSGSCIYTRVPEKLMDTLGALVGCGPAYMYLIIDALADGAVKQGVPRDMAIQFAAQVMIGSGKMVLETNRHPCLLRDDVCSPGGSTICGVAALENGNVRGSLINALEASARRNRELGEMSKESYKK